MASKIDPRTGLPKSNPSKGTKSAMNQANSLLNSSAAFGETLQNKFAPQGEFLGRIDAGPTAAMQQFTGELGAMRNGFTPQEQASLDEQRRSGFQRQLAGQQSAMARRAGNAGARGISALAGQADLSQQFATQEGAAQSDLAAQNVAAKERRMGAYGNQLGANQAFTREGSIYNNDQGAAEQAARQSAFLGGMGLYSGSVQGQQGFDLALKNIQAQAQARQQELEARRASGGR